MNTKLGELNYKNSEVFKLLNEIMHDEFGHVSIRVKTEAVRTLVDLESVLVQK